MRPDEKKMLAVKQPLLEGLDVKAARKILHPSCCSLCLGGSTCVPNAVSEHLLFERAACCAVELGDRSRSAIEIQHIEEEKRPSKA